MGACVVGAGLAAVAGPASAHADLVVSEPAACDVSAQVVTVDLRFDEPLVADSSDVTLLDGDGDVLATSGTVTDALVEGKLAVVPPGPLPTGDYEVVWRTTSARDGDTSEGRFGFTVGAPGALPAPDCDHVTGALAQAGAAGGERVACRCLSSWPAPQCSSPPSVRSWWPAATAPPARLERSAPRQPITRRTATRACAAATSAPGSTEKTCVGVPAAAHTTPCASRASSRKHRSAVA